MNVTDDRQTDRRQTDRQQTDGRQHIANVSSRSLKTTVFFQKIFMFAVLYWILKIYSKLIAQNQFQQCETKGHHSGIIILLPF